MMGFHDMMTARIKKPNSNLTPEEDAARFVRKWEQLQIGRGRAWRNKARELLFDPAPPSWAVKVRGWSPEEGHYYLYVRVPQSTLALRPDGCTCPGTYAKGYHETDCPCWKVKVV